MTSRLAPLAAAILLSATAAHAQNSITRYDPDTLTIYSDATRVPPAITAPDGSSTTPFLVGSTEVSIGPSYQNWPSVVAGQYDTYSVLYEYFLGPHPEALVCVNGKPLGYTYHQCLTWNAQTGAFVSADPGILVYSIAPVPSYPGWYLASITVRITVPGAIFPYTISHPQQKFATAGWYFITGQAP